MRPPLRIALLAATGLLGYARFVRPRILTWGARPEEVSRHLPGDDLVRGHYVTTHAIAIARPIGEVWPWLTQMGYGRGG